MNAAIAAAAVATDVLTCLGAPFANTFGPAVSSVTKTAMTMRLERARNLLLEELRQGDAFIESIEEVDEVVAIVHRYARAAREGTARLNLRLMAKILRGQISTRSISANKFLHHAALLESLRPEEVILVATLYRNERNLESSAPDMERLFKSSIGASKEQLVPKHFPTEEALYATAGALQRTGLVIPFSGYHSILFGTSPIMAEVAKLASFEEALAAEGFTI